MIDAIESALAGYLPKQRWFGSSHGAIRVASTSVLRREWPALVQSMVEVDGARYQLLLGLRPEPEAFLDGKGDAILGEVDTELGRAVAYDAAIDPELALYLLAKAAPAEHAVRARLLGADQSNTSIVFDERLIMKLFRRVPDGPNPDVEMTRALASAGFGAVPAPVGEWLEDGRHLAVVVAFLADGVDGFQLALTSLRDLYDCKCEPWEAGGDFGPDAHRLGTITAELHVASATAFGTSAADPSQWADDMAAQLARTSHPDLDAEGVRALEERLRDAGVGPAVRVHGDYHLGQAMRTASGWYVLDFEGEPARPVEERRRPSSALRDVAGMLRSFHYAAEVGRREHGTDDDVSLLAREWELHNRAEFMHGYLETPGIDEVLPPSERDRELVLAAFELDKAVYEVAYEASHRPEWVGIPLSAVQRILEDAAHGQRTA